MAVGELHVMAARCISSIAWLRKYVKFRWGRGGHFLPKSATRFVRDINTVGVLKKMYSKGATRQARSPTLTRILRQYQGVKRNKLYNLIFQGFLPILAIYYSFPHLYNLFQDSLTIPILY